MSSNAVQYTDLGVFYNGKKLLNQDEQGNATHINNIQPSISDDQDSGFRIGDTWFDTTTKTTHILEDDTTGNAVWTKTTQEKTFNTTQTNHNFSVGDIIYYNSTTSQFILARADQETTLGQFIVSKVLDTNTFLYTNQEVINYPAHGFDTGKILYNSDIIQGLLTNIQPTNEGSYIHRMAVVLDADNILPFISNPVEIQEKIWRLNGTDTYYNDGNVGIGTDIPTAKLDVVGGDIQISAGRALYSFGNGNLSEEDARWASFFSTTGGNTRFVTAGKGIYSSSIPNMYFAKFDGTSLTDMVTIQSITGNVGIGTTTPTARLHTVGSGNTAAPEHDILRADNTDGNVFLVRGDGYVDLPNTTNASKVGIISKAGVPFIHNFNYGNNGTVTTVGFNTFIGENAGNFTMGSTATSVAHASYNTAQGANALLYNTTGYQNSAQGFNALRFNTTGYQNSAQGANALLYNTTGSYNSAQGVSALLYNTTGSYNSAQGLNALRANAAGSNNSGQGVNAGRFISDGTTALTITNQGVFLGADTKALADNSTNEIVIGYNAIGLGSNTAVLGNSSITKTALKGNVGIGTETPTARLHIVGAGNTSATFAQKIENSSGTSLLSVRDDGLISFSNYTFPTADGTANQVLTTDGAGNLSFADGGGGGAGLAGTQYVYVPADGTDIENAQQLQDAYDQAKTMSPSINNRITVIAGPGKYNFETSTFVMDTQFIDLVSLDGNRSVLFNATLNAANRAQGSISVTANDVFIKGVSTIDKAFTIATNLNLLKVENCYGGSHSFGFTMVVSGTFTNCDTGFGGFGKNGTASGRFINCTGGNDSFAGVGTASGYFENCKAGAYSFGGWNGTASGTFQNCQGGLDNWGSPSGTLSGKLYNCRRSAGTFLTVSGAGRTYFCVDGNGNINNQ